MTFVVSVNYDNMRIVYYVYYIDWLSEFKELRSSIINHITRCLFIELNLERCNRHLNLTGINSGGERNLAEKIGGLLSTML